MSISDYGELAFLNTLRGTAFSVAAVWVKLHIGDPGEAGTANPAVEVTRKQATFSAASAGAMSMSAPLSWANVAGTETYSYISLWDASTVGNCLWSGAITAPKAMTAGDSFDLSTLTLSLD